MAGEARRGSFLPLMDLHNDQPLHFPKTQALMIAVPGTLGAQLQTPHHRASPCERYSPSKRTRLLCSRSACAQASGGEHTAPSPPPVCRARGGGCRDPHVGEPHVGGGDDGAWGAEGLLRPVAVERQMWAGAKPPLAGMESDPDPSFFS